MKINKNQVNTSWQYAFEQHDFDYHSLDGKYWIDNYHIELQRKEAVKLEQASNEVHAMCMEMIDENMRHGNFEKYGLNKIIIEAMEKSWKREDMHLYGRFDFAYDGNNEPKMLEYNADTPTSIVETAVGQSVWQKMQKEELGKNYEMLNNLEKAFKQRFKQWMNKNSGKNFYFASDNLIIEDWGNVVVLAKWAREVGIDAKTISFNEVMFDSQSFDFQDKFGNKIDTMFKLYPWEFIFGEVNFSDYEFTNTQIMEPMWKGLLSTKAILPMLWDMFKGHKNLLPAYFKEDDMKKLTHNYVKKPLYSREGANVEVFKNGVIVDKDGGLYGEEGFVYQQYGEMANLNNAWYVFGTWMIGEKMEALAVREDKTIITKNTSYFVPHVVVD